MLISDSRSLPQPPACRDDLGHREILGIVDVHALDPVHDGHVGTSAEAAAAGFVNLKGHRLVGGMRASIYNAMPAEGVAKLVQFMEDFAKKNG